MKKEQLLNIAAEMGVNIFYEEDTPEALEGCVIRYKNTYGIYINPRNKDTKKEENILAHELAHIRTNTLYKLSDTEEEKANGEKTARRYAKRVFKTPTIYKRRWEKSVEL